MVRLNKVQGKIIRRKAGFTTLILPAILVKSKSKNRWLKIIGRYNPAFE